MRTLHCIRNWGKSGLWMVITFLILNSCAEKQNERELLSETSITVSQNDQKPAGEIFPPDAGAHYWLFPESKDKLGSGGKLQIYMDAHSHPHAAASFAKYELGVGGALPEHKHHKTEEIAYFLSGEGVVITYKNDQRLETPVKKGYVWYTAPGEWHAFMNTSSHEPLTLVFATIPNEKKGLLTFFKNVGAAPGKEATTFSPEEFGRIASEHDLILKPANVD